MVVKNLSHLFALASILFVMVAEYMQLLTVDRSPTYHWVE